MPEALFARTSTKRYDNVLIADLTSAQAVPSDADPSAFTPAVVVITVSSKYLATVVAYLGT